MLAGMIMSWLYSSELKVLHSTYSEETLEIHTMNTDKYHTQNVLPIFGNLYIVHCTSYM